MGTPKENKKLVAEAHAWLDQLGPINATELAQPIRDWIDMLVTIGEDLPDLGFEMELDKALYMRCDALADELSRAGNLVMTYIENGLSGPAVDNSQAPTQIRAIFEEITHVTEFRRDIGNARNSPRHGEAAA
jgi:hypothetical protein